jgi:TRAP transporter TAXI family solute receptor
MADIESSIVRRRMALIAAVVTLAIVVAAIWAAFALLQPTPPRTVVMGTGPEGSAYAHFGKLYREIFAREGIDLELRPSAGAVENLARLNDPKSGVSVAFAQGGTTDRTHSPNLETLGTLSYEPLWFFYRDVDISHGMEGFRGKRVSIGAEGSGTRALTLELLKRNGIDENLAEYLPYSPQTSSEKLLSGEIQAALMVTSWDSPVVHTLLTADKIQIISFPRVDAYVALYPFLSKLVLPAGVGDLATNRPPKDVFLLAPKTSLAVRHDLHPAIQYLLLDAAAQIHGGPGIFQKAGQFPAPESMDLPLSENARQFYKSGRPFFQRYLPFWLAVLAGQLLVLLIPVVGVLYPTLRLLPSLYGWAMRRRIFRLYGELKFLETELDRRAATDDTQDLSARLDRLEERANHFRMPNAFTHMLYTLRLHISLVRERLAKR